MGNEIRTARSIHTLVDEVVQTAWEEPKPVLPEESLSTPDVEDQVLNRPPTFLRQLRQYEELITGVCIVAGVVTEMMLVSVLSETHYKFVADMMINASVSGVAIGAVMYAGSKIAKFLNRS